MKITEIYNAEGSELRNLQLIMLDILITVTNICDKYNLPYWISGGTLLGAIRHGGFIPWDDDIDIEMMLPDYKKLLKILSKELPQNLYLQTPKEKNYRLLFSKVRDRNSIVHSEEEDMASYTVKGLFIDIFPEERSYWSLKKIVDAFYGRGFRRLKRGKAFSSLNYFYEYAVSLFLYPIGIILKQFARLICSIGKPKTILHSYGIGNTTKHNATYMFPLSQVTFEGHTFYAPHNPQTYLTKQYGDYMKIPAVDNRPVHFLKVEFLE